MGNVDGVLLTCALLDREKKANIGRRIKKEGQGGGRLFPAFLHFPSLRFSQFSFATLCTKPWLQKPLSSVKHVAQDIWLDSAS